MQHRGMGTRILDILNTGTLIAFAVSGAALLASFSGAAPVIAGVIMKWSLISFMILAGPNVLISGWKTRRNSGG